MWLVSWVYSRGVSFEQCTGLQIIYYSRCRNVNMPLHSFLPLEKNSFALQIDWRLRDSLNPQEIFICDATMSTLSFLQCLNWEDTTLSSGEGKLNLIM